MMLVERAIRIVVDPRAEWFNVDKETGDAAFLAARYVAPLALVPALAGFIGASLVGVTVTGGASVREPVLAGLLSAAFGYVAAFAAVFLAAALVDALAPRFGARRGFGAALRLAVYAFTPVWLAGIFLVVPGLRFLELLGCYGAYLAWTGLPVLMKAPKQSAPAYAAIVAVGALALVLLARAAQHMLFAGPPGA